MKVRNVLINTVLLGAMTFTAIASNPEFVEGEFDDNEIFTRLNYQAEIKEVQNLEDSLKPEQVISVVASRSASSNLLSCGLLDVISIADEYRHLLDAKTLDALASTSKIATDIVGKELKTRVFNLFTQMNNDSRNEFADCIGSFFKFLPRQDYAGSVFGKLKEELFALAKPMYTVAVLQEENYRFLGVQAAELLRNPYVFNKTYDNATQTYINMPHWDSIKDLYTDLDVKHSYMDDTFSCIYLKKSVAVNLERMCQ